MTAWVIGFDLSLRAPAAVALPKDWRPGDWKSVRAWLLKTKAPEDGADQIGQMKRYLEISDWAVEVVGLIFKRSSRISLYVEDYGYSKNNKNAAHIMESGGIVRADIWRRFGVPMTNVSASHARKLAFGFNPRRPAYDPKVFIQDTVFNTFKAPKAWGENECDAFLIAQAGLSDLGGLILTLQETMKTAHKDASRGKKTPRRSRDP
jgi:hypothetical protein